MDLHENQGCFVFPPLITESLLSPGRPPMNSNQFLCLPLHLGPDISPDYPAPFMSVKILSPEVDSHFRK